MKKGKSNIKNKKPSFSKKPPAKAIPANIADISGDSIGELLILAGVVDRIQQTAGPTVFHFSDGTGSLPIKSFEGPGVRAYPEIEEGDAIKAQVSISEFQGNVEGDAKKIVKLSESEHKEYLAKIEKMERDRASFDPPEFLAKSQILDKLKPEFIKAATEIRLAIIQNRPIIVRHHNDADGYSSGFALERAILPLIEKQHGGGKSAWEYYLRAPCSAPFYEIDDSIRDTANSLRNVAKFSNKLPLVIIADNGSSKEDLLGIQQGKVHGIDFIVIDHHVLGDKDVISDEVLAHINPFLVGESGEQFSAGMLCCEIARFINPEVKNMESIAAMAAMADRIDNPEVIAEYMSLAKDHGYTQELLSDISTVIDFVSTRLKFMEAREYIEVVFGEPMDKQKSLVKLMAPYIKKLEARGLEMAKAFVETKKVGSVMLNLLPVDQAFPGFGFYPRPGLAINLLQDFMQKSNPGKGVVTAGVMGTAITLRATDEANFSVQELIKFIEKKLPNAFVEGGGHQNAGAISFTPGTKEEVLGLLEEFIKSRK